MATAKEHIKEIRRSKFSIGEGKVNPLTEDLHQAVKNLSAELYAKDVHFLMELIQNAEDNEYKNMDGAVPSLEFVITSRDITATGALATLLIFNNEKGFSAKNIDSICSVGRSTKKGANRKQGGYIGEKGIGFKSVFLITAHPYIFSNGYQIRFNEDPCPHCNVGFIVPEWVEANPSLSDIQFIYGSDKILPTTTIILPLKSDKINPVKQQLSDLHPEVLLFLSKIKSLSFKEDNHEDPSLNTVNRIAISSETNCAMRKNIDAESYMLHLSAEENSVQSIGHCSYYMWKQKFRVRPENRVKRRMEVDEFWITLAFPLEERLHDRGMNNPGVYAFLPTEMVTNFPFIIQADFVLASSRETILLDDKWNKGILDCVPSTFISAFTSLVKASESAPLSSLPPMFRFIPVTGSSYHKFELIREAIRTKLIEEDIIPSESFTDQKFFHKPRVVGRLMPAFWGILKDAKAQGVSLHNLSSHGKFILSSSFDSSKYDAVLNFLGVQEVGDEWYAKFLGGSSLILEVAEPVYVKLLVFISGNWMSKFQSYTSMRTLPFVKYVDVNGDVSLCSVHESTSKVRAICLSKLNQSLWLIDWNKEFRCRSGWCFVPTRTEVAIRSCNDEARVLEWLNTHVKAVSVDVYDYAVGLLRFLNCDLNLVVTCAHFLYHSFLKDYISEASVSVLCGTLPLVDNSRRVITTRRGVLVPGKGSKWVELMGSNPWSSEGYVELGEAYLKQGHFAGTHTPEKKLIEFLRKCVGASDIPYLNPPNSGIPAVSGPLTQANALLLLEWIRNLKYQRSHFPDEFLRSIKCGNWLRVTLSGSPGCRPPSESFFPTVAWGKIFQNMAVLIDVPLIDQGFYGVSMIEDYREELKMLGVMSEYGEACEYIGKHLMSLASSSSSMTLTKSNVLSILHFIRFLRDKYLPVENFVSSINRSSWLKTTCGVKSPVGSVLFDEGWIIASEISNIPFLDKNFYGEEIYHFKDELKLLGVDVDLENEHRIIVDYLKPSYELNLLKPEVFLLMLQCMHCCCSTSQDKVVRLLENRRCVKTNSGGYNSPDKCFLPDPELGCLLQVFDSIPVVDMNFYGDGILNYKREMKELKVVADVDAAVKEFCRTFRQRASSSSSSITKENVISFLACYRKLSKSRSLYLSEIRQCITEVQWLRTKLGDYRSPRNCILFGKDWKSISEICRLPLLDDREEFYGEEIQQYMKELKSIGVVVKLRDGIDFVISGLRLPSEHVSRRVTPYNVLALLECIRIYLKEKEKETLPEAFLSKVVSQDWLKTHAGYFPPESCCLYNPLWAPYLKPTDGPFIDEAFYLGAARKGGMIRDYRKELHALGVIVDVKEACHLMTAHLYSHSDTGTIMRIYDFLIHFGWETADEEESHQNSRRPWRSVWIPPPYESSREQGAAAAGRWASPEECVLHDKDELFGSSQLTVLDKHYGSRYLGLFSRAFGVKSNPSIDDYYKLWKEWEVSRDSLSKSECCAFWGYVASHWSSKVEKMLVQDQGGGLTKLPVEDSSPGGNLQVVLLSDKRDVFIADDLLLKDIFQQASPRPIFVWYPKRSTGGGHHQVVPPNRVKLHEIYSKIGVKTISLASVSVPPILLLLPPPPPQTEKSSCSNMEVEKRGLVKLILGFLANPPITMEVEKRHEAVKCLANATIFESVEPITVSYELPLLSSEEVIRGTASQMVRWERERKEGSKLFMQRRPCSSSSSHKKNLIEYAQHFGEEISQGVLWGDEKEDNRSALSELIKFGYLLEFDEEAMDFLIKSKNLQVYDEDIEFLCSSIFHSN